MVSATRDKIGWLLPVGLLLWPTLALLIAFPVASLRPSFQEPRFVLIVAPFWAGLAAAPGYAWVVISRWTKRTVTRSEGIWARTSLGMGLLASVGGLAASGSLIVLFAGPCLLSAASVIYVSIRFQRGW